MEGFQFYDQLLRFTLFQGMSRNELMQMAGHTRFDFQRFEPQMTVVKEGDECGQLMFLMKGELDVTSYADDYSYRVVERLSAPWMTEPEVLLGLHPRHTQTLTAVSDCHFIILSKNEIMRLVNDFLAFRLNLLNQLATKAQQRGRRQWHCSAPSLRERVSRFFIEHCSYPAGHKVFYILMKQLANEVNDSRLDVSWVLNQMQADNLLQLHRGRIVVPSLERLFM